MKQQKLTQNEMLELVLQDLEAWMHSGGAESDCSMVYAFNNGFHLHAANLWLSSGAASDEVYEKTKALKINRKAEMQEIKQLCDEAYTYVCPSCNHHAFLEHNEGDEIQCFSCGETAELEPEKRTTKLEILYKPTTEFGARSDVAIHSLKPSYDKLLQLIDDALKESFSRIVVYVDDPYIMSSGRFNIKAGGSTWNRLRRDINGDVRCGEVGFSHGASEGDGFTLYIKGGR